MPSYRNQFVILPTILQQSQHAANFKIIASGTLDLSESKNAVILIDVAPRFTQDVNWTTNNPVHITVRRVGHPSFYSRFISGDPTQTLKKYTAIANPTIGDTFVEVLLAGEVVWVGGETISIYSELGELEINRVQSVNLDDPSKYQIKLDYPIQNNHDSSVIYNNAKSFPPINVTGGCVYEIIFDYSENFTENSLIRNEMYVQATAIIYDGESQ